MLAAGVFAAVALLMVVAFATAGALLVLGAVPVCALVDAALMIAR